MLLTEVITINYKSAQNTLLQINEDYPAILIGV